MKAQTCCCHICRTSLNQYKREFIPCTKCNKIVCKNCFGTKWKGESWEEATSRKAYWECPSCEGTCTCPRCKKSPKVGFSKLNEDLKVKVKGEKEFKERLLFVAEHELVGSDSNDGMDILPSPGSESWDESPLGSSDDVRLENTKLNSTIDFSFVEKLTPKLKTGVIVQLQDLSEREKRCEQNIREMEKLLSIMQKEREEIAEERYKLAESIQQEF